MAIELYTSDVLPRLPVHALEISGFLVTTQCDSVNRANASSTIHSRLEDQGTFGRYEEDHLGQI